MMRVYSPVWGHTDVTKVGSLTLDFQDGVAETHAANDAELSYLIGAGYEVEFPELPEGFPVDESNPSEPIDVGKTVDEGEGTDGDDEDEETPDEDDSADEAPAKAKRRRR